MYLHLGSESVVRTDEIIGIFDLENSTIAKSTKNYLAKAQTMGWVVNVTDDIPKSFVICQAGEHHPPRVYITQISSQTLKKRCSFIDDISNV